MPIASNFKRELIKANCTETQWRYLELHLYQGWTFTKIAAKYGKSVNTVAKTIKRAEKRLIKRLKCVKSVLNSPSI